MTNLANVCQADFLKKLELFSKEIWATLTRPAIAGRSKTVIIEMVNGFTYTTPLHGRSRSAGTY